MFARLGAVLLGFVLSLAALSLTALADPTKKGEDLKTFKDETSLAEQHMARQFNELMQNILKLRDRLKRSANAEDRERAVILDKVLESAQGRGISTQFEGVVDYVVKNRLGNPTELEVLSDKSKKLADDLRYIIDLMRMDTATNKMREKQETLKKIIADIEAAILKERQIQTQADIGKTEKKELQANQKGATDDVSKIGKAIDKYNNPDGQGKEKDHKGDMKDGGKQGGSKAEAKDQGPSKDSPAGQGKEGKGNDKDSPPSTAKGQQDNKEPKDKGGDKGDKGDKTANAKSGDPKQGGEPGAKGSEPKGKESSGGEPSQAKDSKGSPSGSPKDGGAKDPMKENPGEKTAKDGGDSSSKKEKKKDEPAQAKDGGDKKDNKKDGGQQASAKDSKSGGDPKKSGDQKSEGKPSPGESKPGEESKGQAQAKSSGQPMPGSPMPPQPPSQAKGGDSPPPPGGGKEPPPQDQVGKKQVQDAEENAKKAEEEIAKDDKKKASGKIGDVVKDLENAKKKLEELLKQLREEELERLLAALQQRCEKMLAMQIAVYNGTVGVDGSILNNADKKANRENQAESLKLSDNEKDIVHEATKAIELLEAEGSAVAFPLVFEQVREDMKHVQRRLDVTDVGKVTQAIEQDIIDTLKEMIDALKKAKKELDDKKNPPPGEPKAGGPPPDQKLLDQIAELKMIRSMQLRVNTRTTTYGRQYKGEQAQDPAIRREIIQLGDRQEKIYEVTNKIAKGDNK